jgi:hypothetical protein
MAQIALASILATLGTVLMAVIIGLCMWNPVVGVLAIMFVFFFVLTLVLI